MAFRICFTTAASGESTFKELLVEFEYHSGFSLSQKQKSIASLHKSIAVIDPELRVLEVSSKSPDRLGVSLSAFNLKVTADAGGKEYPVENVFQSSKVFAKGGPYTDLLEKDPIDAKRDERLQTSGALECFEYLSKMWPLEPKSLFYDWLYISALREHHDLACKVLQYDAFTDIEFNHKKSINCQARSAAIFVSLQKRGRLDYVLENEDAFFGIYESPDSDKQASLFD